MPARLAALDEGPDIPLDRTMVVVGRHPQCDARLDSLRVSRHHCCMTQDNGEIVVRDLGSTNGIRINGQRVEVGRLRPGDELCIAHIRFRFENGPASPERTMVEPGEAFPIGHRVIGGGVAAAVAARPLNGSHGSNGQNGGKGSNGHHADLPASIPAAAFDQQALEGPLAAMMREILPGNMADRCKIQIIVQVQDENKARAATPVPAAGEIPSPSHSAEH